jgi:hypothetical protein
VKEAGDDSSTVKYEVTVGIKERGSCKNYRTPVTNKNYGPESSNGGRIVY